jgi:hypothetical protein
MKAKLSNMQEHIQDLNILSNLFIEDFFEFLRSKLDKTRKSLMSESDKKCESGSYLMKIINCFKEKED